MSYKTKLNHINTFIFDVDGVLTDGKVYFMENEIMRALNSKDGYALQYASKMGDQIFIIEDLPISLKQKKTKFISPLSLVV